ncbi:MAG: hypothetical protein JST40_10390 [Armatimonadetes bacterium]|nr:hypothetical protein [Armatimonadota bacterium]
MQFNIAKLAVAAGAMALAAASMATPTHYLPTDKWFEGIKVPQGIYWDAAKALAVRKGGYLACPATAGENTFCANLISDISFYSDVSIHGDRIGPWLGGYHGPDGVWHWMNNAPFTYAKWWPGQPDGYGGATQVIMYYNGAGFGENWGDHPGTAINGFGPPRGFVIEYDRAPASAYVELQNYLPTPEGVEIVVDFIDNGNVVATSTATLEADGSFIITPPTNGTFMVRFKASHWLSKTIGPVTVGTSVLENVNLSLINGDVDGDDSVTIFDYLVLSDYFDKSDSDADWNTVGANGMRPVDADLDGDGTITVFDYLILSTNFDKSGS